MKRLVVLGAGESGIGAALLGKQQLFEVFVSDKSKITKSSKEVLVNNEIEWEEEVHSESKILNADLVVKSPGIPDKVRIVKAALEKGISVISEIEFASRYSNSKVVGITGSNGKTTTTMMVYHILKNAGLNTGIAGNIGDSYARQIVNSEYDYMALELSSFQLDGIQKFKPHIAIITNITPDHLDRYDYKFENYVASKFRITMNQTENEYLIYDADDEVIQNYLNKHPIQST